MSAPPAGAEATPGLSQQTNPLPKEPNLPLPLPQQAHTFLPSRCLGAWGILPAQARAAVRALWPVIWWRGGGES